MFQMFINVTHRKKNLSIAPEIVLLHVCNGPDPLSPHILKTDGLSFHRENLMSS